MRYRMSVIYGHPVIAATRALRFADYVTKRNGGSGNENGPEYRQKQSAHAFGVSRCLLILARTRGLYSWPFVNFYVHQETEGAHYLIDFAIWTNSFILTK